MPVAGALVLPSDCGVESLLLQFDLREPSDRDPDSESGPSEETAFAAIAKLIENARRNGVVLNFSNFSPGRADDDFNLKLLSGARRGRTELPFDTGGMSRGRWRVTCESPPLDVEFDTGPLGRNDLRLEARAVVAVEIALLDAATGAPSRTARTMRAARGRRRRSASAGPRVSPCPWDGCSCCSAARSAPAMRCPSRAS